MEGATHITYVGNGGGVPLIDSLKMPKLRITLNFQAIGIIFEAIGFDSKTFHFKQNLWSLKGGIN